MVLGKISVTEDLLPIWTCIAEKTKNARPMTPVSSGENDIECLAPKHFLHGNKSVRLPYFPWEEEPVGHRKLFRHNQAYANLI